MIKSKLTPAKKKQFNIFSEENPKHKHLMQVVDQLKFRNNGKGKYGGQDLGRT